MTGSRQRLVRPFAVSAGLGACNPQPDPPSSTTPDAQVRSLSDTLRLLQPTVVAYFAASQSALLIHLVLIVVYFRGFAATLRLAELHEAEVAPMA